MNAACSTTGVLGCVLVVAGIAGCLGEVRYTVVPIIEGSALQVPEGKGLNDEGVVVGSAGVFGGQTFWIWRNGRRENHLIGGGYRGGPRAIDNLGRVVGWFETGYTNLGGYFFSIHHGFIWDERGTTQLGILGKPGSYAYALNKFGQVVGMSHSDSYGAFLWEDGVMYNLNDLIPPDARMALS